MNHTDLENHLSKFDLGNLGDELLDSAKRALRILPSKTEPTAAGSRFGGLPFVPPDFKWPISSGPGNPRRLQYEEHQYAIGPLRFICQINLSEIPFLPDGFDLDPSGIILFFAAIQKADFPMTDCDGEDWLILSSNSTTGEICEPPHLTDEFVDALNSSSDCPLESNSIELPQFSLTMEEYWQIDPSLLYGHPEIPIGVDMQFGVFPLHLFGGYPRFLQTPVEDIASQFRHLTRDSLQFCAQFDSDDSIGLTWSNGGRGFFFATKDSNELDLTSSVLVTQHT